MQGKISRRKRAALAEAVFERLAALDPEPRGELEYVNPYTLLVAVVLSAQATDAGVNKATKTLFAVADTPKKMARSANRRSPNGSRRSAYTAARRGTSSRCRGRSLISTRGQTPNDRAALESLPGVGRKTANVVHEHAFSEPTHRGGHPRLPSRQPARHRSGKDSSRSRGRTPAGHTQAFSASRSSLADSAWTLCLQGAKTVVRLLRTQRHLPV